MYNTEDSSACMVRERERAETRKKKRKVFTKKQCATNQEEEKLPVVTVDRGIRSDMLSSI